MRHAQLDAIRLQTFLRVTRLDRGTGPLTLGKLLDLYDAQAQGLRE